MEDLRIRVPDLDPDPVGSGPRSSRIRNEIQSDPDLFFFTGYASTIFPVLHSCRDTIFYSTYCEDQNLTFDYGKLLDLDLTVSKGGLRTDLVSFQKQDPDRQPAMDKVRQQRMTKGKSTYFDKSGTEEDHKIFS